MLEMNGRNWICGASVFYAMLNSSFKSWIEYNFGLLLIIIIIECVYLCGYVSNENGHDSMLI